MNRTIEFTKSNSVSIGLGLFVLLSALFLKTEVVQIWKHFLYLVGPTFYVLFPMGILLVSIIILAALGKMDGRFPSVRELQLIEEGAPIVGLLGTVIALVKGFGQLDLTQSSESSIQIMIKTISESLYATPTGLILGLIAWFVHKRFLSSQPVSYSRVDNVVKQQNNKQSETVLKQI
jgi:hypothetical protein